MRNKLEEIRDGMKRPFMMFCLLLILICVIRVCIFGNASPPEVLPDEAVTLQGRIDAWETGHKHTILYLSDVLFYGESAKEISNDNSIGVRCYIDDMQDYKLGQTVAVQGFLALPETAENYGEFNAYEYYSRQGYTYVLYQAKIVTAGDKYDVILQALYQIKSFAMERLYQYLCTDDAGIMAAMILGDKSNIASDTKALYRGVGIYHILAISGLHISMIGGLLYRILKYMRCKPVVAVTLSLGIILLYGVMIGMPPSAFRAIIMYGFGLVAPLLQRSHDKFTSLAFAGACLIITQPLFMLDAGVQLSFLAVLGIIGLYPTFLGIYRNHMKIADGLWVSFAVTYMTLPIIMLSYYEVPIYSLLVNACVLPFVPLLLGLGLLVAVGMGIPDIVLQIAADVIHCILFFYEKTLHLFDALPGNRYVTGAPPVIRVILFYVILFALIFGVNKIKRKLLIQSLKSERAYWDGQQEEYERQQRSIRKKMRHVRLVQILLMSFLIVFLLLPEHRDCCITFIDVGQGDGVCVEAEDKVFLIDCGSTSENNLGTYTLIPFLKYKGITQIDGWFLTHPDSDHISAWTELCAEEDMGGIKVDTLYLPAVLETEFSDVMKAAKENDVKVVLLEEGDVLSYRKTVWNILSPDINHVYSDENGASLVLYLQYDNFSGLFMGDAGIQAEQSVVEAGIHDVTMLKVAHHGSGIETNTEAFLEDMHPQIAVISCGKNNSYGHPHTEVIQRLEKCRSEIYRTDLSGQISIEIKGNKMHIKVL